MDEVWEYEASKIWIFYFIQGFFFQKRFYLFMRERERERERENEREAETQAEGEAGSMQGA